MTPLDLANKLISSWEIRAKESTDATLHLNGAVDGLQTYLKELALIHEQDNRSPEGTGEEKTEEAVSEES